jgi:antirestriction protein
MSDYQIFIGQYGSPTHGEWVDAVDVDACDEAIRRYSEDGCVEIGAFDSEGFGGLPNTESISTLRAIAEYLDGRDDADARLAYAAHVGEEPQNLDREFSDAYQGEWSDEETFVEETFREIYSIPKELEYYIDFEKMARDWFISDFFSVSGGRGVFVFRHI